MPQIQFGHFTRRDVHALDGLRIASSDPLQNDLGINWGKHETIRSKMKRRRKKKRKRKRKVNNRVRRKQNSIAYLREILADHGYCCGCDGDAYCDPPADVFWMVHSLSAALDSSDCLPVAQPTCYMVLMRQESVAQKTWV